MEKLFIFKNKGVKIYADAHTGCTILVPAVILYKLGKEYGTPCSI